MEESAPSLQRSTEDREMGFRDDCLSIVPILTVIVPIPELERFLGPLIPSLCVGGIIAHERSIVGAIWLVVATSSQRREGRTWGNIGSPCALKVPSREGNALGWSRRVATASTEAM